VTFRISYHNSGAARSDIIVIDSARLDFNYLTSSLAPSNLINGSIVDFVSIANTIPNDFTSSNNDNDIMFKNLSLAANSTGTIDITYQIPLCRDGLLAHKAYITINNQITSNYMPFNFTA
jgi:hypothetical protein